MPKLKRALEESEVQPRVTLKSGELYPNDGAHQLARAMVKYRLTQAQLAAQLGWKQTQISKLLRGARPSFDQAIRLLDMVDIPMADWASLNGRLLLNTPKAAPETEPEKK